MFRSGKIWERVTAGVWACALFGGTAANAQLPSLSPASPSATMERTPPVVAVPEWRSPLDLLKTTTPPGQRTQDVKQKHDGTTRSNSAISDARIASHILSGRLPRLASPTDDSPQQSDGNELPPPSDDAAPLSPASPVADVEASGVESEDETAVGDGEADADESDSANGVADSDEPAEGDERDEDIGDEDIDEGYMSANPEDGDEDVDEDEDVDDAAGDFPKLPPDPDEKDLEPLPPLHVELYEHGGSYLYQPEGDRLGWPDKHSGEHFELSRLPENYKAPEPVTMFADFLGADPIRPARQIKLPGLDGFGIEPRFVGYGQYSVFHSHFNENGVERRIVGHQAIVELDLRLTGTERFHVQFRPLGDGNTGGSFFQFDPNTGYVNNGTTEPTRYWVEGSLDSIFGSYLSDFGAYDHNFVVGKFPFQLHNNLLINDEILGVVIAKNTQFLWNLSNLNWQLFYGFNDVDVSNNGDGQLIGAHVLAEYRYWLLESTFAYVNHDRDPAQDASWAGLSATRYYGPWTVTGRGFFKWGDEGGAGDGRLFALEANKMVYFKRPILGAEHVTVFGNAFQASRGWESIARGNFNRVRTAFEVNPLTQIAQGGPVQSDTVGVSLGAQIFFNHDDQSLTPEVAFESPQGDAVFGFGLRYLRKFGAQSFFETLTLVNRSDNNIYDRAGVFSQFTILF